MAETQGYGLREPPCEGELCALFPDWTLSFLTGE